MSLSVLMLIAMMVMYACGISMLLERSFTRMILSVMLIGNATNILVFLVSGAFGPAPIADTGGQMPQGFSDPLPQAFILTAIVITFATTAFMLALLYRSWRLAQNDVLSDDAESVSLRDADLDADDAASDAADVGDSEFDGRVEAATSAGSGQARAATRQAAENGDRP